MNQRLELATVSVLTVLYVEAPIRSICLCCNLTTTAYINCSLHCHDGSAATVPCLSNICNVCVDTVTSLHHGGNGCVDVASHTQFCPTLDDCIGPSLVSSHHHPLTVVNRMSQPSPPSPLSKECGSHHHPHCCQQNVAAITTICCHQYLAVISYCHYPLSSLLSCQLKGCRKCDIIR